MKEKIPKISSIEVLGIFEKKIEKMTKKQPF